MRTNRELLQLLLDNIHEVKKTRGLCVLMSLLLINGEITPREYDELGWYVSTNLPLTLRHRKSLYCWREGNIFWRKRWLKKQIRKDENK